MAHSGRGVLELGAPRRAQRQRSAPVLPALPALTLMGLTLLAPVLPGLTLLGLMVLGAPGQASAQTTAPAVPVAVVLMGSPAGRLRQDGEEIQGWLAERHAAPSDTSVRDALLGDPSAPESAAADGLGRLRALRRSLGLSEVADVETLTKMSRYLGTPALVLLRSRNQVSELLVFDGTRGAYYEGTRSLPASDEELQAFLEPRIEQAMRPLDPEAPEEGATARQLSVPRLASEAAPAAAEEDSTELLEVEEDPGFFEQNWPFLAAGALLAGVVVWFLVDRSGDDPAPPVLRFVPGD